MSILKATDIRKSYKMLDVVNSMNSKKSFGGTSTKNVKRMIIKYRKELK